MYRGDIGPLFSGSWLVRVYLERAQLSTLEGGGLYPSIRQIKMPSIAGDFLHLKLVRYRARYPAAPKRRGYNLDRTQICPIEFERIKDQFCPDESYYHTILLNDKKLRIVNQCLTYIDWNSGGAHPKTLGYEDFPKLLSSDSLFARKFPLDERLLQDFDAAAAAAARRKTHSTA